MISWASIKFVSPHSWQPFDAIPGPRRDGAGALHVALQPIDVHDPDAQIAPLLEEREVVAAARQKAVHRDAVRRVRIDRLSVQAQAVGDDTLPRRALRIPAVVKAARYLQ